MDDVRLWLHAIRLGWRIVDGVLEFKHKWRKEEIEAGVTNMKKTIGVLQYIMNG